VIVSDLPWCQSFFPTIDPTLGGVRTLDLSSFGSMVSYQQWHATVDVMTEDNSLNFAFLLMDLVLMSTRCRDSPKNKVTSVYLFSTKLGW